VTFDLRLSTAFYKAHGHGNDYLVFETGGEWRVSPRSIRQVCHRQRGPGGDGVVVLADGGPPFRLRMFNPDGTEFERSGNGLRVLGAYLFSRGRVEMGRPFPVEVGGDRVNMEILGRRDGGLLDVAVDMGEARFGMAAVGGRRDSLNADGTLDGPDGAPLVVQPVSVGNPHCVVLLDRLHPEALVQLGPFLAGHAAFPNGTNVQLMKVATGDTIEILIWERGVGRTASSGTSACASASAAVHRGLLEPGEIRVRMEGGEFTVTVAQGGAVRLEGPVQAVLEGRLAREFLDGLEKRSGSDPDHENEPRSQEEEVG